MLPKLLLPRFCKILGALLYVGAVIYAIAAQPDLEDLKSGTGLLVQWLSMVGLLLFTCAREKVEDEWIARLRLVSLQWAVLVLILTRAGVKTYAWAVQDGTVSVQYGVSFLLLVYALVFHGQLYGWRLAAWRKDRNHHEE